MLYTKVLLCECTVRILLHSTRALLGYKFLGVELILVCVQENIFCSSSAILLPPLLLDFCILKNFY